MNRQKKSSLIQTYRQFLQTGLGMEDSKKLKGIVDEKLMGFGTTIDEKIMDFAQLKEVIKQQKKQSKGMDFQWKVKPLSHYTSSDENTAVFADEVFLKIVAGGETVKMYMRFSIVLSYINNHWKVIHWHGSKPENVQSEEDTFGIENWKQKAETLEKLVEERTLDLLEKNRELEIEAALERVRARTMAMHNSNELAEVAVLLFEQLKQLGIEAYTSGFNIWDTEMKNVVAWMSNPTGAVNPPFVMPIHSSGQHLKTYNAWKQKETFFENDIKGNDIIKHYQFLRTIPFYKEALNKSEYVGIATPARLIHNIAFFAQGYLLFITLEPCPQFRNVFIRFANVFEQTYTRFLDLQKAEAQVKEAQIEAGLERVRSRSLAMHHTSELQEVIHTVHKELLNLNIAIDGGSFITINKDIGTQLRCWGSGGTANTSEEVILPLYEKPFCTNLIHGIKSGPGFFTEEFSQREKKDFFTFLFQHDPWSKLNAKQKKETLSSPGGYTRSCCVSQHTSIFIINHLGKKFSGTDNDILKRFGKVFEQSYTRFIDLQKAEAQAREAQIQLALERVRARTMAMQKSSELLLTADLLFDQLKQLGAELQGVAFAICDKNSTMVQKWTSIGNFSHPFNIEPGEQRMYEAWKYQSEMYEEVYEGEKQKRYYELFMEIPEFRQGLQKVIDMGFPIPAWQMNCAVPFKNGYVLFIITKPFTETQIFLRFGKVFEQTYTRFLDLQKAEAQAREAQIEAALERVRSRTMGMQKSEELQEIIKVVYAQLVHLNLPVEHAGFIMDYKERDDLHIWLADEHLAPSEVILPWFDSIPNNSIQEAKEKGKDTFNYLLNFEEKNKFYQDLFKFVPGLPEETLEYYFNCPGLAGSGVLLDNVGLYIENFEGTSYSEEENATLMRFGKVFQQTYTRFLDLQKAEAQAREAQIEAGLERVRSRAMAMQSSEEVNALIGTVFTELTKLDLLLTRCIIWVFEPAAHAARWWMANIEEPSNPMNFYIKYHEHPAYLTFVEEWKKQNIKFVYDLKGQDKINWDEILFNETELKNLPEVVRNGMRAPERVLLSASFNNFGALNVASLEPLSDEHFNILLRFAKVFDLTYTRFLDLQKAEAQAKEAQIEAALERVRGKAMAMHSSKDLAETIRIFYQQMKILSITPRRCGVCLMFKETHTAELSNMNTTEQGDSFEAFGNLKLTGHRVLEGVYENWVIQKEYHPVLRDDELREFYKQVRTQMSSYPEYLGDAIQYGYFFYFPEGSIYAWTIEKLPENDLEIYRRFTSVLSLTYKRYMDLQTAEVNARETIKQAALDRIRAEIASMRTTNDLERITPLIWNELSILGIPFVRCGVFIMDEDEQLIHTFLSNPEGKAIAAIHIPYATPGKIRLVPENWKKKTPYTDHWNDSDFIDFANALAKNNILNSSEEYLAGIPHGGFHLHFLPFLQGMLYVGNITHFSEDEMILIQSVADAFSSAYSRYEDFNKLEAAKKQVDSTLTELQATQKQLIQSEKMASLGELTAGIAHEIQNPLNFVNNFSEVSNELMDEMKVELAKGNWQLANEIADDIKQNLEKINHHGKRADAIVKGMLQHSRASTGKKEPTDINALCDEYLRLSYHGLRAKDKTFNAEIPIAIGTDFDSSIGKINIVPQDIGRVLLNIINNAFFAASLNPSKGGTLEPDNQRSPTVWVKTKREGNKVLISVRDNGPGIPKNIVDKIFQPFFTTKPTGQGTGLGLSLAYDIVKAHGGEIKVVSKDGEGSEFMIQLPAV